jgi:hypothetical protein
VRRLFLLVACLIAAGDLTRAQAPIPGERWACSLEANDTAAVCAAAGGDGNIRYVTDVVAQSLDASAGLFGLVVGTTDVSGSACQQGKSNILPVAALSTPNFVAAPNTGRPTVLTLSVPLRVPPGKDLCLFSDPPAAIQVLGYLAP